MDSIETDHCGSCTRCLEACPTQALTPYDLDATRCISYWTIEQKKEFSEYQKQNLTEWVGGCDICQEVCPWNRKVSLTQHEDFFAKPELLGLDVLNPNIWTESFFQEMFQSSSLSYMGYEKFVRNLIVVIGNLSKHEYVVALEHASQQITQPSLLKLIEEALVKLRS